MSLNANLQRPRKRKSFRHLELLYHGWHYIVRSFSLRYFKSLICNDLSSEDLCSIATSFKTCHGKWGSGSLPSPWDSQYSLSFSSCRRFVSYFTIWYHITSPMMTSLRQTTYTRTAAITTTGKSAEKQSIEDSKSAASEDIVPQSKSYLSQLKIYSGAYTDVSLFKLFFRPFPFLLSPVVCISPSLLRPNTNLTETPRRPGFYLLHMECKQFG